MSWHGNVGAWFADNWTTLVNLSSTIAVALFTGALYRLERSRDTARLEVTYFARVNFEYDLFIVNRGGAPVSVEKVVFHFLKTPEGPLSREMAPRRLDVPDGTSPPIQGGELARFKVRFRLGVPEGTDVVAVRAEVKPVFGRTIQVECEGDASSGHLKKTV